MTVLPMRQHLDGYPVVAVHNYLETFQKFLSRSGDKDTLFDRRFNGDQALYWLGDDKLIISSAPIANTDLLCQRWGYQYTRTISPKDFSVSLCQDIVQQPELLQAVLDHAGPDKKLALVPYANTPEFFCLAATLQHQFGLNVYLPESPAFDSLWIKEYLDSKVGFRTMVTQWAQGGSNLPCPPGFICQDLEQAAYAVEWFRDSGKGCVVKASEGGSGVGNFFLPWDAIPESVADVLNHLHENIYFKDDLFVVEELIHSLGSISPSLEYYVPPKKAGEPRLTYLSDQHFEQSGRFAGVLISRELDNAPWYPTFATLGTVVAAELQNMGYVGYFDMDSVVDVDNRVYAVEFNTRRTGGTWAHEFMEFNFGSAYEERFSVLAQNKLSSGRIQTLDHLEATIGDLLYPMNGEQQGVIVLLTSKLSTGFFGFLALAGNLSDAKLMRAEMVARIQAA